jgi:hypothetical protein
MPYARTAQEGANAVRPHRPGGSQRRTPGPPGREPTPYARSAQEGPHACALAEVGSVVVT